MLRNSDLPSGRLPEGRVSDHGSPDDQGGSLWEHHSVGSRTPPSELVGRTKELDVLEEALRSVTDGDSQVVAVLLGGDAGIGKSRRRRVPVRARSGWSACGDGCVHPTNGGGLPYGPFVGILRDLVRQVDDETAALVLEPADERPWSRPSRIRPLELPG